MRSTTYKLGRTFKDYELLGASQSIALVTLITGGFDREEFVRRINSLPERIPELDFTPRVIEHEGRENYLTCLSEIYSSGVSPEGQPLVFHIIGCPNKETALLMIFHHSFTDGLGGIEIFRQLADSPPSRSREHLAAALAEFTAEEKRQFSLSSAIMTARKHLQSNGRQEACQVGAQRAVATLSMGIRRLRPVKRQLGITLNEIYLLAIISLLKRCYPDRDEVTLLVPVNLRSRKLMSVLGNFLMVVPAELKLGVSSMKAALESVRAFSAALSSEKRLRAFRSVRRLLVTLPRWLRLQALKRLAGTSTCIATYVPDTLSKREFCSGRITSQFGLPALLPGHELGFCLMTTQEEFCIAIVTAGRFLNRGEEFRDLLSEAVEGLIRTAEAQA